MKKISQFFFAVTIVLGINACKTLTPISDIDEMVTLDTIEIDANSPLAIYRASEKRINDLIHTKLEVSFDWDSAFLYGNAHLKFSPYFYATDSLTLDAKGFQIHQVALLDAIGKKTPLNYSYDSLFLRINLEKFYKRTDTFEVFINYTAMPNKLKEGGSAAITSDKGLYFINHDGSDPKKPKQIWTQGETEASSCWFPTIDAPNEKTTQEIYITVDSVYETLSNGSLIFQTENEDGSRTDYWKQELPHAPYLFMMAVGDFAIVKDVWNEKPVHYYVEHKYEDYAREIYANTPEMLTFFSEKLGYEYPWDKYHQVVVRDYVSGAMENTSAVIFGDFVQGDDRFLIDNSGEDIVAHELFHHWFGDLVTCESWSNLPLNESFATYGEYLWNEYKYGKDAADYGGLKDKRIHIQQTKMNPKKLIRFHYENKEDMFDTHSYGKGGRILHMLRKYLGDDAFFAGLQHYLKENEFQAVEVHQLRLALEKVSGEDLNWFFNQWFLGAGHPILKVENEYIDSSNTLNVTVSQSQEGEGVARVFEIPTSLGIVDAEGKLLIKKIRLTERNQSFTYSLNAAPQFVNLDVEKILMAEIDQAIEKKDASLLYELATNYVDRRNAISMLKNQSDSISLNTLVKAFDDSFWDIRRLAITSSDNLAKYRSNSTQKMLSTIAQEDKKSLVRAAAINALSKHFSEETKIDIFKNGVKDPSYRVVSASLNALYEKDKNEGIINAENLETEDNSALRLSIAKIYAEEAKPKRQAFYEEAAMQMSDFSKYAFLGSYANFIEKQTDEFIGINLTFLEKESTAKNHWFVRMAGVNAIIRLNDKYNEKVSNLVERISNEEDPSQKESLVKEKVEADNISKKIKEALNNIQEKESSERILNLIRSELE